MLTVGVRNFAGFFLFPLGYVQDGERKKTIWFGIALFLSLADVFTLILFVIPFLDKFVEIYCSDINNHNRRSFFFSFLSTKKFVCHNQLNCHFKLVTNGWWEKSHLSFYVSSWTFYSELMKVRLSVYADSWMQPIPKSRKVETEKINKAFKPVVTHPESSSSPLIWPSVTHELKLNTCL